MNGGGADDGGVVKPGVKKLSVRANIMTSIKYMLVRERGEGEEGGEGEGQERE